ncbi:hypothetical protein [Xanthomonas maliensis]|uniref:hypothetical protein n=1 Tax=Xanthomonas maliensis TaxID=1321368 RepID=UPI0003A1775B|nr:hypothetical protein [Xanthomonas maliensis]
MRRTRGALVVALLAMGGLLLWRARDADEQTANVPLDTQAIARRHGVAVLTGAPATLTVSPHGVPIARQLPQVSLLPLDGAVPQATLQGLDAALAVYPQGAFGRLCRAIVLVRQLRFAGAEGGGTAGGDFIVLASDPNRSAQSNRVTARLGVHHEFSSLIWQRQPAMTIRWRLLMPAGWQPAPTAAEALSRNEEAAPPLASGVLSAYGATSLENDFNTYAEIAFDDPARMRNLARMPIVAAKLAVLREAYVATDPAFAELFARLQLTPPVR